MTDQEVDAAVRAWFAERGITDVLLGTAYPAPGGWSMDVLRPRSILSVGNDGGVSLVDDYTEGQVLLAWAQAHGAGERT